MYSYLFEEFIIENQNVDFKNPHLWILNSDKIPPHIGISQDFKFFSLKASGAKTSMLNFLASSTRSMISS